MNKIYLLAAMAVTLTSCDAVNRHSLKGTYRSVEKKGMWHIVDHLEVTDTKFVIASGLGEQTTDYKVEDGYIYAGSDMGQIRFKIVGSDTLLNTGNLGYTGTYVRVRK